ncbi:MAG: arsenate reductase ArsC [Candidatus Cloacimonetes bacterium]|nr:arsenate reductase ArsC [Candidatus Cloacimonadota bacterium]
MVKVLGSACSKSTKLEGNVKKVLVLCTGNSCRSVMAEALINHYLGATWQAYSAGTHPSHVHPRAIQVLQELGIDTAYLKSKGLTEFLNMDDLDLVISVCDQAKKHCAIFPKAVNQVHISIADPVLYTSAPEEEALASFRSCRDDIKTRIVDKLSVL